MLYTHSAALARAQSDVALTEMRPFSYSDRSGGGARAFTAAFSRWLLAPESTQADADHRSPRFCRPPFHISLSTGLRHERDELERCLQSVSHAFSSPELFDLLLTLRRLPCNSFALVFLSIMLFYPLSLLLLLYNRPTLLDSTRRSSFLLIVATLLLDLVLLGGVVAHDPMSVAYLAAYGTVLTLLAWTAAWWGRGMRWVWWVAEHGLEWKNGARWCVRMIRRARRGRDVVILVKGDEVRLRLALSCRAARDCRCQSKTQG